MTRPCVGVLSIRGVLDQPSQSKLGPVNLQKLCLFAFGDESALLIVDGGRGWGSAQANVHDALIDVIHRIS